MISFLILIFILYLFFLILYFTFFFFKRVPRSLQKFQAHSTWLYPGSRALMSETQKSQWKPVWWGREVTDWPGACCAPEARVSFWAPVTVQLAPRPHVRSPVLGRADHLETLPQRKENHRL